MKVRIKTIMAGPEGNAFPGDVCDLPEAVARVLLDSGKAERYAPESASLEPREETAALAAAQPKRAGRRRL